MAPAYLADLVQGLSQELLVDATEVGHLPLALVVHVHAAVWGEGERARARAGVARARVGGR